MHPSAVAQLMEDLQTTKIEGARVERLDFEKLHWSSISCIDILPSQNEKTHGTNVQTTFVGLASITRERLETSKE